MAVFSVATVTMYTVTVLYLDGHDVIVHTGVFAQFIMLNDFTCKDSPGYTWTLFLTFVPENFYDFGRALRDTSVFLRVQYSAIVGPYYISSKKGKGLNQGILAN